ncbi:hypothetical protein AKJ09_10684 [Labilithrix luteola]|uniref:Bacterial surface antigen (D15) domain-containing protein n=1 Tax=Labilithrix luteola TaxID=1391654 RepID=A0A0K1QE23_9BACT|nr:hypothetical protein [Labilithrix luteola]AKV04021.1 hypothetical protein AKJ09_10684 [Labilithrix luteola]
MRWFVIAGIAAIALVVASASSAAPTDLEPLRVELSAPEACPSSPTLFDRVRAHTARVRRAEPGEPARSLVVRITPSGNGFVARLDLVGPALEGEEHDELERRVPGKTCSEVLAAVALITALTIDPLATAGGAVHEAPPAEVGVANDAGAHEPKGARDASSDGALQSDASTTKATPTGKQASASTRGSGLRASVGVSLDAYGLGELVLGESVWVEGDLHTFLEPALRLRFARSQSFTADPDGRPAFFRLNTASLEGCVTAMGSNARAHRSPPLALRPCLDASVGAVDASSAAYGPALHERRAWASIGGLLQGRWFVVGPLSLEAAFGLTVPLIRDDFFFRPQLPVYRVPAVMLVGNVGVGLTFP